VFDSIVSIVRESKEAQAFGWNALTATFIFTVAFTIVQAWGFFMQGARIFRERKADAVSVPLSMYSLWYFVAFFMYGVSVHSLGMMINSLLAILYIPIVVGIVMYGKRLYAIVWCIVCTLLPVGMAIVANKDQYFFAMFVIVIGFIATQPLEIWWKENAGAVEPKMYYASISATTFWFFYGCAIGNWVIIVLNPVLLVTFAVTLYFCRRYPSLEAKSETKN
jgi:uncharacterized protein with PQ loop repeat